MNHSDSLAKIAPALVAALGKIEGAAKKKTNPGFKSKYADLETVIDASRDILTENGLTVVQLPGACAGGVMNLETVIMHESGEWISGEMGIALGKTDPQGVGSALTYARRYALMAALNMPAVDDDAQAATGRDSHSTKPLAQSEPSPTKTTGAKAPAPPTLAQRADRLETAMRSMKTQDDLRKAYGLASGLCAELDDKDPERLSEIEKLYETLFERLAPKADAFGLNGDQVPEFVQ